MLKTIKEEIANCKPRNYKFIGYSVLYALYVMGIGMIIMGKKGGIEWIVNLIEMLMYLGVCIVLGFIIIDIISNLFKKEDLLLLPKIQWWLLVIIEGVLLLYIFIEKSPLRGDLVQLNFDNSVVLVYTWISIVPIIFAAIHIGCKIMYGYRLNEMQSTSYQKLQSIYNTLLKLSFFMSIILAIGYQSYAQESALVINYFFLFFVTISLNQLILSAFYTSK